ncbi:MAE_28990/MAE_18760 family HEPN-like nuclease [Bordetella bronchiseptica]|uniref:MAE_28990/MAE_18760 family HEPN-like nuclease n=1 Tax=Bordetella bronchiseptica TaxID=518 RepID=UPI0009B8C694|nr:MAE_28990/MAE_18760 family HEPN-like nuclease [Bordetella bronchiseptica]
MTALLTTLSDRKDEFAVHLALAQAMEGRLLEGGPISIGETALTVRHLMTIKSGLIVHLYNVVEALMSRTIEEVCTAVKATPPDAWSINTLKEWLRFNASIGLDGNEDSRLEVVHKAALQLLRMKPIEKLGFKKPSGTWSDKVIYTFSQRLNVRFELTPEIAIKIRKQAKYGDKTPLEFLADRRNAIAHGRRSFEDGATDLSLADIHELADVTIEYMELAISAFQSFVDEKSYMVVKV